MSARIEMAKLRREMERQGYTVTPTGGGHWKFTHPSVSKAIYASNSPRSYGGVQQCRRDLQKARDGRLK